jgi:CBS domain-containing protein
MRVPSLATVMTPFPHAIDAESSLDGASAMMAEHDFHHLPVIRDGELVGVVSATDVARAVALGRAERDVPIENFCATKPHVVDIRTALVDVVSQMADRGIDSVLVTRQGKLVGILTHTDVSRLLARFLHEIAGDGPDDDDVA